MHDPCFGLGDPFSDLQVRVLGLDPACACSLFQSSTYAPPREVGKRRLSNFEFRQSCASSFGESPWIVWNSTRQTNAMSGSNTNVQLLTLLVDSDDKDDSDYRFLVNGKDVKYVTVAPGAIPRDDRTFAPVLIPMLPPFPLGDWNKGHVSKDPTTGQLFFARHEKVGLDGITYTWHPRCIDFLELKKLDRLRQNIQRVSHPLFDTPIVVKFAEFPWQIPRFEAETTHYEWIEGKDIGPEFLGHVTEAGRVMGWLMEDLGDAHSAEPGDLAACQEILGRLHSLGVKHGEINRFNFMVRGDKALLIDFETAENCSDQEDLEAEYGRLEQSLKEPLIQGRRRTCRG